MRKIKKNNKNYKLPEDFIEFKDLRLSYNLSQADLAVLLGVKQNTIHYYESGKILPDLPTAREIADFFGVPLDKLFFKKEINEIISRVRDEN